MTLRSWRRALREGSLPPALLFWSSGLQRHLVLDGHDRIAAALAEGVRPHLLLLAHLQERPRVTNAAGRQAVADEVARQLAASRSPDLRPNRPFRVETANRLLIDAYDDRPDLAWVSRAWPLDGGRARWRAQVAAAAQALSDDEVRDGLLALD